MDRILHGEGSESSKNSAAAHLIQGRGEMYKFKQKGHQQKTLATLQRRQI